MGSHQLQQRQRPFSWQDLDTPSGPPVYNQNQHYQQMQTVTQPQQLQFQQTQQVQQPTQLETSAHHRGFSWAQTPIEHGALHPSNEEPMPPIFPNIRSQSQSTHCQQQQQQPQSQSQTEPSWYPYPDEKPPIPTNHHQQTSAAIPPFSHDHSSTDQHPTQENVSSQNRHVRQRSNLSPINTNVGHYIAAPPLPPMPTNIPANPLPSKPLEPDQAPLMTPISAGPTKRHPSDYPLPHSPTSGPIVSTEPYSPHGFRKPEQALFSPDAIFSPHAAHGPSGLEYSLHQPGQVMHPNMEHSPRAHSKQWKHGLCACAPDVSTCLTGVFCPCILYGRTSYRLSQKSAKNDPTDLLSYKATNGSCLLMSAACGLWWMFPMMQRIRIRRMYKLEGGCVDDVLKGCCCCCCASVQNEREVREREESNRRWAGPACAEVYTSAAAGGMIYKAQN